MPDRYIDCSEAAAAGRHCQAGRQPEPAGVGGGDRGGIDRHQV